jgi:hypothetical protein
LYWPVGKSFDRDLRLRLKLFVSVTETRLPTDAIAAQPARSGQAMVSASMIMLKSRRAADVA